MISRPRLVVEVLIAAVLGLAPMLFSWSQSYFANRESGARVLARISFTLNRVTDPGAIVGALTVSTLGAYGIADLEWRHETPANGRRMGWREANRIGDWVDVCSNSAMFASLWLMWRSGGRPRKAARIVVTVWLAVMVPLAAFASLWTVYS